MNLKLALISFTLIGSLFGCSEKSNKNANIPTPSAYSSVEELSHLLEDKGQTVYVPVYSHIPAAPKTILSLHALLSVRNTSSTEKLIITSIEYFDTNGKLVKTYLKNAIQLNPMATYEVEISSLEVEGGTGANFIVKWNAEKSISSPIIESLMYGSSGMLSYSFISRGQVVERH